MKPFLVTLASADNHWMFVASNGGLTAGRESAAYPLFPYTTEDKLVDLAHVTGPLTWVIIEGATKGTSNWQPLDPLSSRHPRR